MECRSDCGACCIAPSISSPIPGLPQGKPAGIPCPQLDGEMRCRLFYCASRPAVCGQLKPCAEMCGISREAALSYLGYLEQVTAPGA